MNTADELISENIGLWWTDVPLFKNDRVGCLGGFTSIAPELLHKAESRLREEGCTLVIGPMMGNTWRTHRAVIESNGREPFLFESVTDPELARTFEDSGYEILMTYSSSLIDLRPQQEKFTKIEARMEQAGVSIRPLDPGDLEHELRAIHDLSLRAFRENFLYSPINENEFVTMYLKFAPILTPECAFLAEDNGQLVGFVFGFPQGKTMIVKTLAVLPERRLAGLGTLLVSLMQESAKEKGCLEAIHALQREDNQSLRISQRFSATIFRRYALFSKSL